MDLKPLHTLIGSPVVVVAGGITYRGLLIEITEDEVQLQGESQWITIQIDNINSINAEEG